DVALLVTPLVAEAQQAMTTARVGFLQFGPTSGQEQVPLPLVAALREHGWVEGATILGVDRGAPRSSRRARAAEGERSSGGERGAGPHRQRQRENHFDRSHFRR